MREFNNIENPDSRFSFRGKSWRGSLVSLQNRIVIFLVTLNFFRNSDSLLVRLGSVYGGWWIPSEFLSSSHVNRVVFSIGIGHDVTFDEAVVRHGFKLIALDPLKECVEFAEDALGDFKDVYIENFGLSNFTGQERFFPPKIRSHDSWSSINVQQTSTNDSFLFKVISLSDLLVKYESHLANATTILKMDIEGAESKIFPTIYSIEHRFDFIAIEMDFLSLVPFLQLNTRLKSIFLARRYLKAMDKRGYRLIKSENFNFFWG
jgi:FkbM family methyltransferase